ncbi:Hypothetical protein, conserved [Brucella abortus str. 2308 A]|nr:Hypothetical protein, conserved [Brucella abortus str. 2308 A]
MDFTFAGFGWLVGALCGSNSMSASFALREAAFADAVFDSPVLAQWQSCLPPGRANEKPVAAKIIGLEAVSRCQENHLGASDIANGLQLQSKAGGAYPSMKIEPIVQWTGFAGNVLNPRGFRYSALR